MGRGNYNRFWRWHFYAALFMTPLLITLTLSGVGYLFYTNVENNIYSHLFFGTSNQAAALTMSEGIEHALHQNEGYSVSKVNIMAEPYNTRLVMTNGEGEQKYVFLDNQNQVVGSQNAQYTYSNVMRNVHSSLFVGGTVVNYLVELAACWAIFLLLSGVYMTLRGRALKKQNNPTVRQKNLKWHALAGMAVTIPMAVIIFTGLPWSALMGNLIYSAAQEHPSIGFPVLKQSPPTSDRSEIPWATRKNEAPTSSSSSAGGGEHAGHGDHAGHTGMAGMEGMEGMNHSAARISVQQLMVEVEKAHIAKPYSIIYPGSDEGVYTVAKSSNTGVTGLDVSPYDEVTAYFDQYSGGLISKVSFADYGVLAKWFSWGIPLHEGHLFGWPNKLINLAVCLAFLLVIFRGFQTWLARKKKGALSPPPRSSKVSTYFLVFMVLLGVIMPLFGLSLIVAALIEVFIYFYNKGKHSSPVIRG